MNTIKPVAEHLIGMTWERWCAFAPAHRATMRDKSDLHPQLLGLEGVRVRVKPSRAFGRSTFRVGITTGWRPVHLAMRTGANGSSDIISAAELFETVTRVK